MLRPSGSQYRNSNLEELLGREDTDASCSIAHKLVWDRWIRFSLAQQHADFVEYLRVDNGLVANSLSAQSNAAMVDTLAPIDTCHEERQLAASNLGIILILLCRSAAEKQPVLVEVPESQPAIFNVLALIRDNYHDPLFPIDALSRAAGISQRQIARLLKLHTGKTSTECVRGTRLERAQHLLRTSEDCVRVICAKLGYGEPSWFCRHFRDLTGSRRPSTGHGRLLLSY